MSAAAAAPFKRIYNVWLRGSCGASSAQTCQSLMKGRYHSVFASPILHISHLASSHLRLSYLHILHPRVFSLCRIFTSGLFFDLSLSLSLSLSLRGGRRTRVVKNVKPSTSAKLSPKMKLGWPLLPTLDVYVNKLHTSDLGLVGRMPKSQCPIS